MDVPSFVKPYPKVFEAVFKSFNGNSVYPWIFLKSEIYEDLSTQSPNPRNIATLNHELLHYDHQSKGIVKFGISYLCSRQFRFNEELAAYNVSAKIYKSNGIQLNTGKIAKALSGPPYLWAASYGQAKSSLDRIWEEA